MLTVTWGVTPLCGVTLNFFSQTVDLQRLRTRTLPWCSQLGSFFHPGCTALNRRRKQLLSHQKCVRVNFFDVRACAEQSPLKAHPWVRATGPRSMEARPERASLPASGGAEAMAARGAEAASAPPRPASTAGGTASWQQRCAGKRAGLRVRTASRPLPPKRPAC